MIFLTLAGCGTPHAVVVDTSAEETKLRDGERAWVQDLAAKDLEKIVAHYADNATLMAPGLASMNGKEAIRGGLKQLLADPNLKLEFSAQRVEVSKSGDIAYSQGAYKMTMSDPKTKKPVEDNGSYVTVYKKQEDGSWKAVQDINTSEAPPPGQ